jgi:tripartite-type tricarboxylate transporter receptor subunit TctC
MSNPVTRRDILQGLAAIGGGSLLATGATSALAQAGKPAAWPTKPIRVVVPFNAGGATDIIARSIGEALAKRVGQPVVVDNRGGAAGILGTEAVAKAAPDGHTLMVSLSTSMLINQFLYTKLPTIHEQGVTDDAYSIFGWVAMGAPAGVPKEIVDQLYGHLREIAKDPKVLERITGAGFMPMMNSPQAFRENYQRDMPIWKALVEQAGAKLD